MNTNRIVFHLFKPNKQTEEHSSLFKKYLSVKKPRTIQKPANQFTPLINGQIPTQQELSLKDIRSSEPVFFSLEDIRSSEPVFYNASSFEHPNYDIALAEPDKKYMKTFYNVERGNCKKLPITPKISIKCTIGKD